MSRAGYSDDGDGWALILWRGAVNSAIKGARGQALLRELLAGLDAMPEKRLVAGELQADGSFCALGVVGHVRGLDLASIDTYDVESLGPKFNIAEALAREIMFINDEHVSEWMWVNVEVFGPLRIYDQRLQSVRIPDKRAGLKRWLVVRKWALENIIEKEST